MTTAVTDQLLRDLVVGSHAEGTTRLAVAAAIEHEHRVPLVTGTGNEGIRLDLHTAATTLDSVNAALVAGAICHAARRPGVSAKTTPTRGTATHRLSLDSTRPRAPCTRWVRRREVTTRVGRVTSPPGNGATTESAVSSRSVT